MTYDPSKLVATFDPELAALEQRRELAAVYALIAWVLNVAQGRCGCGAAWPCEVRL
jgi:hypothetical protein